MKNYLLKCLFLIFSILIYVLLESCSTDDDEQIPIPNTEQFEQQISAYNIYQGEIKDLIPTNDYNLLELNSSLFSNYAEKQRLVRLPEGTQMSYDGNGIPVFPEGTILVKTFFYFNDARDTTLGKKNIETRLLIKNSGLWNVATYVWNDIQTDATLELNGYETQVSWTNMVGTNRTIMYQVPNQNECISCHQYNSEVLPVGPKLRNMNFDVTRNNVSINQLEHLQSIGILERFNTSQIERTPNYKDSNEALVDRGRAYLDMNCAHCHNPAGWNRPARTGYDFRLETTTENTKISNNKDDIKKVLQTGEMPYLGTTVIDEEGINLVIEYIDSL